MSSTALLSVKMTIFCVFSGLRLKTDVRWLMDASMAVASASKFVQYVPHASSNSSHVLSGYSMRAPYPALLVPLKADPSV